MPRPTPAAPCAAALCMATALAACVFAHAAEPPLPRSVDDARAMERRNALPLTAFYATPSLTATKPGDLLRRERGNGYATPEGTTAVRILYHSLDAVGRPVATSAVVLVPPGKAPAGGWPVIAWAHGTTGVARQCAPSLMKDMQYGELGLMPMVRAGYAVVATDYHGLGTVGPHEYVNKLAHGRDVIYAMPAARRAVPALGARWVVIGHSQGGYAAWGVAELEATLHDAGYLGAISVAGSANMKDVLDQMSAAGIAAGFYLTYMAYAIHARTPQFEPADMLAGASLERYPAATTQGCWNYAYASFLDAAPGPALKPGWEQAPAVAQFLRDSEVGGQPIGGPLLVVAGEADRTVPYASLRATSQKACRNGLALTFRSYAGQDHDAAMDQSMPEQLAWTRDRFAGLPAANDCPALAQ